MTVPPQKPMSRALARAARTMPEAMYTGMPGTGGSRKSARPTAKKTTKTTPKSTVRRSSFSQDRKMNVAFATPTERTQYSVTHQLTFMRMSPQFQ